MNTEKRRHGRDAAAPPAMKIVQGYRDGKDSNMLVSQRPVNGPGEKHGCFRAALAELQRRGAGPSGLEDVLRQRLLVLARRLARVRSLGNEYARVGFSEHVEAVVSGRAPAI